MANVTEVNICRVRGDTTSFTVTLTTDGTTPIDITGDDVVLTVDPSPAPPTAANNLFTLTGVLTDPTNGVVTFTLTTGEADQAPGTYFYDVQWTDTAGSGAIATVLKGEWQVVQDITK